MVNFEMMDRESVMNLIEKKDKIEKEITQLKEVLDSNSVGLTGSLVDNDGYPREDIDVYAIRHARHRIICLQNDHKALMKEIEEGLHQVHAGFKSNDTGDAMEVDNPQASPDLSPIAKVDIVDVGSPASLAGVQVGDLILQFGSVTDATFTSLQDIGTVVKHSINKAVTVTVSRSGIALKLQLTPKPWGGKGLLGCNILPFETVDR